MGDSELTVRAIKWALLALGLACLPAAPAGASAYVLGDSLGLGISQAARLKNLSKLSVHIRGPKAVEQFAHTPPGSTVFLSLGTNDAHGSIARLDKSIDAIVRAAERKKIKLIWMGPPCIRQSWDTRARDTRRHPAREARQHVRALRQHARRAHVLGGSARARRRSPEDDGLRPYVGEGAHGCRLRGCLRRSVAGGDPDRVHPGSPCEGRAHSAPHSTKTQAISGRPGHSVRRRPYLPPDEPAEPSLKTCHAQR